MHVFLLSQNLELVPLDLDMDVSDDLVSFTCHRFIEVNCVSLLMIL